MKILIDGYWLDKPRGLGRYVREALHALSVYAPAEVLIDVLVHNEIEENFLIRADRINYIKRRRRSHPIWEQFVLPWEVWKHAPDIVHCPYNTAPVVRGKSKYCITIHDLIFKESLGSGLHQNLGNIYRRVVCRSLRYLTQTILTVSQASADAIWLAIQRSATVIYTPTETFGLQDAPDKNYVEGSHVILHVGGRAPHKNTERVIAAYNNLKSEIPLVVLGVDADDQIAKRYKSKSVLFPGWIDDNEVRVIYKKSILLVFPSLMEGYGLPIIEAFTAGVPVLTSNRPPMNEIANGAALLVDPENLDELESGMRQVVNDKVFANKLKNAGRLKLEKINGRLMCEGLLACYSAASRGNDEKDTAVDDRMPYSSE
jgi:glycosyltransferase involved in cell wall biosynthesis